MTVTKERRKSIAKAQKITDIIGSQLKQNDKKNEKIDMSNIASQLFDRKEKSN